jgi:hypothetical protein
MKLSLALLAFTFIIAACTTTTSSNPDSLRFHEVVYGGCANVFDMPESSAAIQKGLDMETERDTLIITWDDSLNIFLGLNYVCCVPFEVGHEIVQDTLVLAVRDTCVVSCYCDCICYYTFTWKFERGEEEIGNLLVELFDPRVGTIVVLYREQLEAP